MVTLTLSDGSLLSDAYVLGEGLSADQTSTLTFGLGTDKTVQSATIQYAGGSTKQIESPAINQVHKL